jgi:signal peptidase I
MEQVSGGGPLLRPLKGGRRAWFALSLSMLCPGWGHLYAGADGRALAALALAILLVPASLWVWMSLVQGATSAMLWGAWTVAEMAAIPLDSARVARRPAPARARAPRRILLHLIWVPVVVAFLVTELHWVYAHFVQPYWIPTESMVPNLIPGDAFFVDVRARTQADLKPGDVIVFGRPGVPEETMVKRIAARAGQTVAIRDGELVVDGQVRTSWLPHQSGRVDLGRETLGASTYDVELGRRGEIEDFGPLEVPRGQFFVLGDSRYRSADSRSFGPIPISAVRGRVLHVFWSWDPQQWRVRWNRVGLTFARMRS